MARLLAVLGFALPLLLKYTTEAMPAATEWACPPCTCKPDYEYLPGVLVNCTNRNLKQVPKHISPAATALLLSYNHLTELLNDSFQGLDKLRELTLSHNNITTIQEDAFVGLSSLFVLSLEDNRILLSPAAYPPRVFEPLVSLKTLHLNKNVKSKRDEVLSNAPPPPGLRFVSEKEKPRSPRFQHTLPEDTSDDASTEMDNVNRRPLAQTESLPETPGHEEDNEHIHGFDYPDKALSQLPNLKNLYMDGLPNKVLGAGFALLKNLTFFGLSGRKGYCSLGVLTEQTFYNISHVRYLNLSGCSIQNVVPGTFNNLRDLHTLDLSFNKVLGMDLLPKVVHGLTETNITVLHLDAIVPSSCPGVTVTAEHLQSFRNLTSLQHITARFNMIERFEEGVLCSSMPPNLKEVYMEANMFQRLPYINDMRCMHKLEELYLNGFNRYWTPELNAPAHSSLLETRACSSNLSFDKDKHKLHPSSWSGSWHDSRQNKDFDSHKQFDVAPNLRVLKARHYGLFYKLKKIYVNRNNSLEGIDLSENHFPEWTGPVTGLKRLRELYLTDTFTELIQPTFFNSFPDLHVLDISGNRLRNVFKNDPEGHILKGLRSLRNLTISRNDLGSLYNSTFSGLANLRSLVVSINGMGTFGVNLSHMTELQHLDLSQNQIRTLPMHIRDHLDKVTQSGLNVTVNMTFNPISCSCENIDFLKWIRESKVYFGSKENYFCQLNSGFLPTRMEDIMGTIAELERTCGSFVDVFVGASACCVIVVVLLLVALAYRFRWKLRYLYYASRLGLQRDKQQERQQEFHYDAFVSFASEDVGFVNGDLRQQLEDQQGMSLCIHTRDFIPGQYIASNIVDSVQRSRRTLVVLTRALLDSDWCHYELQMALMESVHSGRDILLFLLYEHVPAHELSRDMLANLQATSYIEFPHSEQNRDLFWRRLAEALRT